MQLQLTAAYPVPPAGACIPLFHTRENQELGEDFPELNITP